MNQDGEKINRIVFEARPRDERQGIVRLNVEDMEQIGAQTGDILEVTGGKTTGGIAWPGYPQDQGNGGVRLNKITRKNASADLEAVVSICLAKAQIASKLVLQANTKVHPNSKFNAFVRRKLLNAPVSLGDEVIIPIGISRELVFTIVELVPKEVCKVGTNTNVQAISSEGHDNHAFFPEDVETFKKFIKLGKRFKIDDFAQILGITRRDMIEIFTGWAEFATITIDGDFIIIEEDEREKILQLYKKSTEIP